MNLIPRPYRWLAIAALAVALTGLGWVKGAGHVQSQWDAAVHQQTLQIAAVRQRQAEATVQVVTRYVDRVRVVREKGDTIIKEVPIYVPVQADAACTINRGSHRGAAGDAPMTRPPSPVMRRTVAGLTLSAAALVGIVLHEGYTDRAVIPVKGDVPTIGFGTTTGVKLGDTTTPPKALARALTDVQQFEGALKQCVTVPLAQHEYDALVTFSYNVGSRAFCQSTLVRKLNVQDYAGACAELLRWRFFQGKDCALPTNARLCGGLATRREAEYRQCIGAAS